MFALMGLILVGSVVKLFIFPVGKVAADVRPAVGIDILQMHLHAGANLPADPMHDRAFVFDGSETPH
jgi:hypothetical protein